jgi:hypothetical protein
LPGRDKSGCEQPDDTFFIKAKAGRVNNQQSKLQYNCWLRLR